MAIQPIESFETVPMQTVIPAYLYTQYADDPDVTAFFTVINQIGQGYLNWYNQTPLPVWTSPAISDALLDWIGTNLYNTTRPVIATDTSTSYGAMATYPMATQAMASFVRHLSGTAQIAPDDLYKRVLTWILYRGDGKQATIEWLRRRIARFLYGINGSDIYVGLITNVSISSNGVEVVGPLGTAALGTLYMGELELVNFNSKSNLSITIPDLTISKSFTALFNAGFLPAPFQMKYSFTIS